jgi:hypothetical protein
MNTYAAPTVLRITFDLIFYKYNAPLVLKNDSFYISQSFGEAAYL